MVASKPTKSQTTAAEREKADDSLAGHSAVSLKDKSAPGDVEEKAASSDAGKPPPIDPVTGKPIVPVTFRQLFQYSTRFELFLDAIGVVCAAAAGSAQPLMTLIFGNLTTSFVGFATAIAQAQAPGGDKQALIDSTASFKHTAAKDALYIVIIGIALYFTTHVYMYLWTYTGEQNSKRIREKYLQAVLRQEIAFFDTLGAGEVATRIQTDTHLVQQGMSEKIGLIVTSLSQFATGFIIAYARSWRLALALTSMLPCIAITGGVMTKFGAKYQQTSIGAVAEGGTLSEEVISTVRTAQAFGTQNTLSKLYDKYAAVAHGAERSMAIARGIGTGFLFFVIYGAYGLAFQFGTTLILHHHANAGIVVNVFLAILMGAFALVHLAPEVQAVAAGRAAAAKLFATIERVPPIDSASDAGLKPKEVFGTITFENVQFHYPARPDIPILKGLTIEFPAGKTAALVGASGSGKSTVISLVERFYDPVAGSIKLDGVDLKDLNVKWLRQQIGLVQQEPSLFATTIKGNVAHGLIGSRFEHLSEDEKFALIKEACIKANADSFIQKLPNGYDTMVGERGFLLSGGQKQRVAIARAIVSDPRILLLDEATSALDTRSEGVVQDALDKAAAGRTTITIAHRLSTIKDADQIYVVGAGEIVEHGTHNELLASENGAYAQLVSAQKLRGRNTKASDSDEQLVRDGAMTTAEVKEIIQDEEPEGLKRTATSSGRSVASEALEKKRQQDSGSDKEYSMFYLLRRLEAINREDRLLYIMGLACTICAGMVYPSFGIIYAHAISSFSSTDPHELRFQGDRNALWMFVIAVLAAFAMAGSELFFGQASAGLVQKLRSYTFKAILRQDIAWFDEDRNSTGALVSMLSDSPTKISGLAGITLSAILSSLTTVIGGMIIGLIFAPKIAAVGIACIPLIIGGGYIRLRLVVMKDQTNKRAHDDSAQLACEAAGAVRTVQSLTRENDCFQEYSRSLDIPAQRSNRTAFFSCGLFALSTAMTFFAFGLVFWYGSRLVANLTYTIMEFFVCLMSIVFGCTQAGNVFSRVPDISAAKGAASAIITLLDTTPEIDAESPDGVQVNPKAIQGRVQFDGVHFRYPTRPGVRVLRNLNLVVEPGTYVALVGASGCGKSTTIQLIERFYDPLAGRILLDGQDISTLNIQSYRKEIALVSQEPTLYAGTILFNILLGATRPTSEITQEEIEDACRSANILEFIQSLPQGFETEVGGKGSQLSGGQKQRIAIARALLRNPKVLLLDEATSALDSQSEKVVQAALDNAAKGRTTIAIAHRLATIQNADRIYFIKEGRVAEAGTHDELLALKGGYFELVQLQALSAV